MERNSAQTITLINSIIGVGILSMPFCFQQCGIVLSLLLLLVSAYITKLVCNYMIKSAIISRRKNFEQIAFYAFGSCGKLLVELCVVGYLLGTCVAYFVVVGDLGPQITAKILSMNESSTLRLWVMIVVTLVCIVPLGLLRNVDSLSSVCTASLGFYLCLVLKIIVDSREQIRVDGWFDRLNLWRVDGILQCLPIFSMALSCQMQLYEIYATMPTTSLDKMSRVIQQSTNLVTCIYALFGFFGYVSFNEYRLSGNILVNFAPSFVSDIIKIGFVLSVAFSFPLVIFPCRVSLYSLIYKRTDTHFYIPESKFRPLTIAIVAVALLLGVLIPSVEVVIGFVGSTIGVAICIIIPAACYMNICKTNMTEKQLAQVMIAFGFVIMVLGTYANLDAVDRTQEKKYESLLDEKNVLLPELPSSLKEALKKEQIIDKPERFDPVSEDKEIPLVTDKILPKIDEPITVKESVKLESIKTDKKNPPPIPPVIPKQEELPKEEIINRDAILKEEKEIAVEEKEKIQKEISELQSAKKVLEAQVEDMKEQLVRKNEETQQLVLKKFDEIVEKIDQKVSKEKDPTAVTDGPVPPVNPKQPILNETAAKPLEPNEAQRDPIVQLITNQGKLNNKTSQAQNISHLPKENQPKTSVSDQALELQLIENNVTVEKQNVIGKDPSNDKEQSKPNKEDEKPLPPLPVEQKQEPEEAKEPPKTETKHENTQPKVIDELPEKDKQKEDDAGGKRDLLSVRSKRNIEKAENANGLSKEQLNCVKKTDDDQRQLADDGGGTKESTFRQQDDTILDGLLGGDKLVDVIKSDLLMDDGKIFKK